MAESKLRYVRRNHVGTSHPLTTVQVENREIVGTLSSCFFYSASTSQSSVHPVLGGAREAVLSHIM